MIWYLLAGIKYLQFKFKNTCTYGNIPASVSVSICLYFCQKYIHIPSDTAGRVDRVLFRFNGVGPQASPSSEALAALPPSSGAAAAAPGAPAGTSSSSSPIASFIRSISLFATAGESFLPPGIASRDCRSWIHCHERSLKQRS